MKTALLILFGILSMNLYSQTIRLSGSVGYNSSLNDPVFNNDYDENGLPENHRFSFGKGVNYGLELSYLVNSNLEFFVLYNYTSGNSYSYKSMNSPALLDYNLTAQQTLLVPGIKLNFDTFMLKPYFKIGPSIGFNTATSKVKVLNFNSLPQFELSYQEKVSYGLYFAAGLDYKYSDKILFFTEFASSDNIYSPDKLTIKDPNSKSVDFELIDKYNKSDTNNKQLKNDFPFSYIGIKIGIRYSINL